MTEQVAPHEFRCPQNTGRARPKPSWPSLVQHETGKWSEGVACVYPLYVESYRAVANCAADCDRLEEQLLAFLVRSRSKEAQAAAINLAVRDALNRIPIRARVHVCRLKLGGTCAKGCKAPDDDSSRRVVVREAIPRSWVAAPAA